jgi:hypothetical protein
MKKLQEQILTQKYTLKLGISKLSISRLIYSPAVLVHGEFEDSSGLVESPGHSAGISQIFQHLRFEAEPII